LTRDAQQLIEAMLTVNPACRTSASTALLYPFFSDAEVLFDYSKFHCQLPSEEYFAFEYLNLDAKAMAKIIREDVNNFNLAVDGKGMKSRSNSMVRFTRFNKLR
jgi:hypothetical protein